MNTRGFWKGHTETLCACELNPEESIVCEEDYMKYLCYYDIDDRQNRKYILSAKNKLDYIFSAINSITDEKLEIISMSETKGKKRQPGRIEIILPNATLILFSSFGKRNILTKILDYVFLPIKTFLYLLIHTKKDENVIVYHSLSFCTIISIAKKIKHFRLILELEEIYSDVSGDEKQRKKELKFSDLADGYIFPTFLMDEKLNSKKKPSVIVHGTYHSEKKVSSALDDDKIHIIYAGTLDPRKGGALAAAGAAKYLSSNYHLHILGFGTEDQIQEINQIAISNNSNPENARLTYDGLLSGDEYIRFIQSCDIGLSTQNPKGAFNNTSFPSKILSYMGNGLRVVSAEIDVVVKSDIGDLVYYYQNQTPQEIANAIMSIDLNKEYDSRERLKQLDRKFIEQMKNMV